MSQTAWVFFCPPSWMIVGVIDEDAADEDEFVLLEAAYIESVSSGSIWDLAHNAKAAGNVHRMSPNSRIRRDAVLIREPADMQTIKRLTRADDKKVIAGAK